MAGSPPEPAWVWTRQLLSWLGGTADATDCKALWQPFKEQNLNLPSDRSCTRGACPGGVAAYLRTNTRELILLTVALFVKAPNWKRPDALPRPVDEASAQTGSGPRIRQQRESLLLSAANEDSPGPPGHVWWLPQLFQEVTSSWALLPDGPEQGGGQPGHHGSGIPTLHWCSESCSLTHWPTLQVGSSPRPHWPTIWARSPPLSPTGPPCRPAPPPTLWERRACH